MTDTELSWAGENVRGLDEEIAAMVLRTFLTRQLPQGTVQSLRLCHVKGILLHGPPGETSFGLSSGFEGVELTAIGVQSGWRLVLVLLLHCDCPCLADVGS